MIHKNMRPYLLILVVLFGASVFSAASYALNVSSPYVSEGVLEIENRNRVDFDSRSSEDGYRQHQFTTSYGFTSNLELKLVGDLEKNRGESYKYTATEVEALWQLTKTGEYWADVALKSGYKFSHTGGDADKVEFFLLAAKNFPKFRTIFNIGFDKEVGSGANANPEGDIKWMGQYKYMPLINPGIEYYGELGEISNMPGYSEQKHRLGPVIYGKFENGVKYEFGPLFGISRGAEDYAVKLIFKYELPAKL